MLASDKVYQGLWVSEYPACGMEFMLFIQRKTSTLEAIKVTGDYNVRRGEYSFIVSDITEASRVCHEEEFTGSCAYKGSCQVAVPPLGDQLRWIDVEGRPLSPTCSNVVILVSNDEVAIYERTSQIKIYYKRVVLEDIVSL